MGKSTTVPTIAVPPRGSMETLFANGSGPGFSPGPMTLVSSFFSEQSPFSFSQLLAGAMNSPMAMKPAGYLLSNNNNKDSESGDGGGGYKRNRPVGLVVGGAQNQMQQQQVDSLSLNLSPMFMFPPGLSPSGLLSPLQSPFGMSHQQALAHVTAQAAFSQSYMQMQAEIQRSSTATAETPANHSSSAPKETSTQERNPTRTEPEILKLEASEVSQFDHKITHVAIDKPASDGYNWRKYGQKHVKGSEFPRSYYKCTHLNCPVKKKVERSSDGRVNEITYKGQHNHDLPPLSKRGKESCVLDRTTNSEVKAVLASSQNETNERNETEQVTSERENLQATRDSSEHHLFTWHNNDSVDKAIVIDDEDDDEPSAKRRNADVGPTMPAASHQTVSEAKIVVQTRSEVDLLDDGFKWRKYGQKIVKGNSHPRSYYRCTYPGCNVRKQVERASADPKSVITTYEGKHDHEIPKGKYSNHGTTNANSQQLKTHKTVAQNPLQNKEMDYGNIDQTPMTLQLKDEQIAA